MDRGKSTSKDAKFHLFIEEKGERRFLGTLCCAAEDVVRAGAILRGELYIKRVQRFDIRTVEKRHRKLPMFLQRKKIFESQESRDGFNNMMKGFLAFLEDLRHGGKCAVLSDDAVLAVGEETLSALTLLQEPRIFLHIPPHLPPSPPTPSPASRDGDGCRGVLRATSTPARLTGDQRAVPATPVSPQQNGGRTAMPDTSTPPHQSFPPGPGGQDRSRPRDLLPSGGAGAGVGGGRGTEPYAAIATRSSRVGEGAGSHQPAAAPPGSRPRQHMVRTSQGWVDASQGVAPGAHSPLSPATSQANGQVRGNPGAGAGGDRTAVSDAFPGRERRLISRRGRGGAGASGQGNDNCPADTPSPRIGVGSGGAPRKCTPAVAVGGGGCSDDGGRDGDGGGGSAARIEKGGLERSLSRSTSSMSNLLLERRLPRSTSRMNDSFFINLADNVHTWAFGAIAELIHNSSDAGATEVRVSLESLGPEDDANFVVIDDGHGMTHEEVAQLFTIGKDYGHGPAAPAGERIGCHGVGFKQGVLRLGDTAVVVSVRGKVPVPDLPPEDIPTASFGILSIERYRRSLKTKQAREPVVIEYATLNLLTMQADERYNTHEEYEAAMAVIRSLVPYFTREYLATYVAHFVPHADGNAWKIRDVKSSTSIFVSRLRKSSHHAGPNRFELIKDIGGTDIRLEARNGDHPHRPRSCNEGGELCPPMDSSLRSFFEQIFLKPKIKIFVQGSEVKPAEILMSLEDKETFDFDILHLLEQDEIIDSAHDGRIALSEEEHGPPPPYNIAVHVGQDGWHREKKLSGIMVYFENCLVDSYARGRGLPDVVPKKEFGYLAIVSFSGSSDKRLFRPNPNKVGFPSDNHRYISVLQAAGEGLTQVVQNVYVSDETPLAEDEGFDNWIECYQCGKSRKVSQEYFDQNEASQTWHCGIEGSPVPLPEEGSNKCHTEEEQNFGRTVNYTPSATISRVAGPREVFSADFTIKKSRFLGQGSSASVFAGYGYQGDNNALKVFTNRVPWKREKEILWELANAPGKSHPNICGLAWICPEKLTLALKPLFLGPCNLSQCMHSGESRHVLTNHVRLGIAEKVADALRHLHKRGFCHNDVQPSNIVLGQNPKEEVLLVDFGQAYRFSKKQFYISKTPLRYAPPELLKGGGVQTKGEGDMFGFGVTMVELFAGQALFGRDAVRDEAKLKKSLRTLTGYGNLRSVKFRDLQETLPGLKALHAKDGMGPLAKICRACVTGDKNCRLEAKVVVQSLAKFRSIADFHWRHETNIVYHALEPGDRLHFSGDGAFLGMTRLPGRSGKVSIRDHIRLGSAFGWRSQCISCSLTLAFCIFYAQKQRSMFMEEGFGLAPILEIDLSKLGLRDFGKHVFDGTKQEREGGDIAMDPISENFAGAAEEVVIDDVAVPSAAVTAVWSLDSKPRSRESKPAFFERACQLQKLHKALNSHADERSTFSTWEKHFNKFIRQKGDKKANPLDLVKEQARVPNDVEKGGVGHVLRASSCARRLSVEGAWPSGDVAVGRGRGAHAGGASSGRGEGASRIIEYGTAVAGGAAEGKKRAQLAGVQMRPKPPKSVRVCK